MKIILATLCAGMMILTGCTPATPQTNMNAANQNAQIPNVNPNTNAVPANNNTTSPLPLPTAEQVITAFANSMDGDAQVKSKGDVRGNASLYWKMPDGVFITAKGTSYSIPQPSDSAAIGQPLRDQVTGPERQKGTGYVRTLMEKHGFKKSAANSKQDFNANAAIIEYVEAFERGNMRCTWTIADGAADLICVDDIGATESLQRRIMKDLNLGEVAVYIHAQQGDFVGVNVAYMPTGAYLIAKNENGKFRKIFEGQDVPPCSMMEQEKVPQVVYQECYKE